MSEQITHTASQANAVSEFMAQNEALHDTTTRRDFFEHLDDDSFIDLVQQTASTLRTGDNMAMQYFDGEKVRLATHEVPDQRDKEELLRETWSVAKSFLLDRKLEDEEALTLAGLTVAGGIIYTHPFIDGNGRTGRVVSHLIARGSADAEQVEAIIGEHQGGGEWYVDPLPGQLRKFDVQPIPEEWPNSFNWEDRVLDWIPNDSDVENTIKDSGWQDVVLMRFLESADDKTRAVVEPFKTYDSEGKLDTIDGDKALKALLATEEGGITNASELLKLLRNIRADTVHAYLTSMQNGEYSDPTYLDGRQLDPESTHSDYYKQLYERQAKEFGKRAVGGLVRPRDEIIALHRARSGAYHRASKNS